MSAPPKTFKEAADELFLAVADALALERMVDWIDRQLRRSPRLYRWLGGKP